MILKNVDFMWSMKLQTLEGSSLFYWLQKNRVFVQLNLKILNIKSVYMRKISLAIALTIRIDLISKNQNLNKFGWKFRRWKTGVSSMDGKKWAFFFDRVGQWEFFRRRESSLCYPLEKTSVCKKSKNPIAPLLSNLTERLWLNMNNPQPFSFACMHFSWI